MSPEPTEHADADRAANPAAAPPEPAQPAPRRRSIRPPWEAIVAISTAAGVVIALIVGLPNLLRSDPPPSSPSVGGTAASPSPRHASIFMLSPAFNDRVPVTCVQAACAIEVRGRYDRSGQSSLHPYLMIAYECCPGTALSFYVQWDSTREIAGGDWTSRAYVAKPSPGATFQLRAVLTTQPIRPSGSGDDLVIWSDAMDKQYGVVARSDLVTVKVANVVEATAFCDCS